MVKVLIVEDDDSMVTALKDGFEYEGYAVTLAKNGAQGLELATSRMPDIIILDVMLPKMSGLDVCKKLRSENINTPIIMLTARGQEIDRVLGLRLGADDYITKPFSFMELIARVEAVLRRTTRTGQEKMTDKPYQFGDVVVDFGRCEARKGRRSLELSAREFKLLKYFIEHKGEVIERDTLLNAVWDYNQALLTRTVDMHVAKLRKKLEDDPADPRYIVTVHRFGYKFVG